MTVELERLKSSPVEFVKNILKPGEIKLTAYQEKLLEELKHHSTQFAHRSGGAGMRRDIGDLVCFMACAWK